MATSLGISSAVQCREVKSWLVELGNYSLAVVSCCYEKLVAEARE
jgi:hypothetical protein